LGPARAGAARRHALGRGGDRLAERREKLSDEGRVRGGQILRRAFERLTALAQEQP